MKRTSLLFHTEIIKIALTMLCLLGLSVTAVPQEAIAQPPELLVAIHVSELTWALETMPAVPPTPTGPPYFTGYQWWYTTWHYFVAYESLKEALRSDGTPFVVVSDSDIAAGKLRNADGSPRYPILISLTSEAIADNEISPLRDYVNAGGFLFVGSSAFTRYPDGTNRGDFALGAEMGVHMANSNPAESNEWNWYLNEHFTKATNHRLVSHIPSGTLTWSGPSDGDEVPWGITPTDVPPPRPSFTWSVVANGATVLANGESSPLLTVKSYGKGQFIYHGAMQPLVGHGVTDPSTYVYFIYRKAIEWAFESLGVPIVKLSPWQYPYDAALVIRHDDEEDLTQIKAIEASAQFEHSLGARGDYYFCTGALRTYTGYDKTSIISSMRNAVTLYGATIGSHNGGPYPGLQPSDYSYWHWGPDEVLDLNPPGYANGKAYASASILMSYNDIEGWLAGTDNGRPGCGASGTCPRIFVAPFFNATREDSKDVLAQLGTIAVGEEKIGPFPHFTLSYRVSGKRFNHVSLPTSDWYVGTTIPPALEMGHTSSSIKAAVDFYHDVGGLLINYYGHEPSNNGALEQLYVTYSMSKPRLWTANAVGVYDWWLSRSHVIVAPTISTTVNTVTVTSSISGATDPETAIELALPHISGQNIVNMSVLLNGVPAGASEYRTNNTGVKVRVGTTVSTATVQYSVQTNTPALSALSVSPTSVAGGNTSRGTVTLSAAAPSGGAVISLSDNSSAASEPATVTVPGGSTSATFTITTTPVAISTPVTISASYGGVTKTATLTVTPPALSALSLNPTSVRGGSTSQGTVRLSGPAPNSGTVVSLSDNSSVASEPASVTIPGGSTSATFTITTTPVNRSRSVTISAVYNGVTRTATLRVTRY